MDVIGELLRKGLLTEIGEGEERLDMVRSASNALAKRFNSDLLPMVPHAVVAGVDESSAWGVAPLAAADEELVAVWETVRNAFADRPLEVLRAMLLSAVATAADASPEVLGAGWYSLRTASQRLSAGRWAEPLGALVKEWDDRVWGAVAESWSPVPASSKLTMPAISKFEEKKIDVTSAARDRAKALSGSGHQQTFSQSLMAEIPSLIDELLDASSALAAESHRRSVEELRTSSAELGKRLREVLVAQEATIESMRLRSELLWWQRTSFSPSRRVAYEVLKPPEVPLVAALDLHLLMPNVAPLAAEHLLSGLVEKATGKAKVSIDDMSGVVPADWPTWSRLDPALILDAVQAGGATPLLDRGHHVKAGTAAVLVFRDLQCRRLTNAGAAGAS